MKKIWRLRRSRNRSKHKLKRATTQSKDEGCNVSGNKRRIEVELKHFEQLKQSIHRNGEENEAHNTTSEKDKWRPSNARRAINVERRRTLEAALLSNENGDGEGDEGDSQVQLFDKSVHLQLQSSEIFHAPRHRHKQYAQIENVAEESSSNDTSDACSVASSSSDESEAGRVEYVALSACNSPLITPPNASPVNHTLHADPLHPLHTDSVRANTATSPVTLSPICIPLPIPKVDQIATTNPNSNLDGNEAPENAPVGLPRSINGPFRDVDDVYHAFVLKCIMDAARKQSTNDPMREFMRDASFEMNRYLSDEDDDKEGGFKGPYRMNMSNDAELEMAGMGWNMPDCKTTRCCAICTSIGLVSGFTLCAIFV